MAWWHDHGLHVLGGLIAQAQVRLYRAAAWCWSFTHRVMWYCVVQYLKSIRCERNRKTGFKCPRGTGKGTSHKDPCPGKIDKSHPIHPRNEEQKKKKKV